MRLPLVLVLALAGLAAAGPHDAGVHRDDVGPHDRHRRFLLGWDVADDFFHNVAGQIRRAWAESAAWVRHTFSWARRHPEDSTVYRVRLPHGNGVVAVIESRWPSGQWRRQHFKDLVWDGSHLGASHGGNATAASNGTISVLQAGVNHTVPLAAFAKYLSHVPAGSRIRVDIRGSSWDDMRVVLRVLGQRGEDPQKSVSVLLSTVLKEIEQAASQKSSSQKASSKTSSSKKSTRKSSLRWDGRDLVWKDVGSGKHVRRRLRVTQDGTSQVIPFSVLALHLKAVPASDISFEVTGHTLKDLRVLLHVLGDHKQTISLLVSKLMEETEARKHSGSVKPGRVRARVEGKKRGKKVTQNVAVKQL